MTAIRSTCEAIRARLDQSFRIVDPREDDWVVLSNVVNHQGQPFEGARNKVVMSLIGIGHETTIATFTRTAPVEGNQYGVVTPPLYVFLMLLFTANFQDERYAEGLGAVSRTIAFFQQYPCFSRDAMPELDPVIEKLTLEITNMDLVQTNYVTGMLGIRYLPSVLYKLRLIPFRSDAASAIVPAASGVGTGGSSPERGRRAP